MTTNYYYVVTNGSGFVFWDSRVGNWNVKDEFEPICLLEDTDASSVVKQFNAQRQDDDQEWVIQDVRLEFKQ